MTITAFGLAERFIGTAEIPGVASNALVLAMLQLDNKWPQGDDVPWCSAFANFVAWLLRLPRSKQLGARSWLMVGQGIALEKAEPGFDVVVLTRGTGTPPGPDVIDAPGHVGFFAGHDGDRVLVLGGNQGDRVSVEAFPTSRILGIRRLA